MTDTYIGNFLFKHQIKFCIKNFTNLYEFYNFNSRRASSDTVV